MAMALGRISARMIITLKGRRMKININPQAAAGKANQLTALIDLGEDRPLYPPQTAHSHPAWPDVERRFGNSKCKTQYVAFGGDAPLVYLPAWDARFWDDNEKIRILAARAWEAARERQADELVVMLDGPEGAGAAPLVAEG